MEKYELLDRTLRCKGSIVDFCGDHLRLPDGQEVVYDFVKHKGAAAIVPVDPDGKIVLVRQYRPAIDKITLEIPAGGLNEGEDMKNCATRECEEETGWKAHDVEHLVDIFTALAYCNEKIGIYVTRNLTPSKQHLDETEFVNVESYTLEELVKMILDGTIEDTKTITAILTYKAKYCDR